MSAAQRYRTNGTKIFWVLSDQGVVSAGNFFTQLMLARHLGLKQLGVYAILYELTLFLNSMQASTVLFPLIIRGAVADQQRMSRLAGRALVLTLVLVPIVGSGALAVGALIEGISVGLWAMVAMTVFQVQETLRRALIAHVRYRTAVWGDAVSYIGQAVIVAWLASKGMLTLTTAFQAFAVTSALGAIVQLIQVRPQLTSVEEAIVFARKNWSFSRWVLYGNVTSLFTGSLFFWNLAYWHSRELVGVAQGLINVDRLANPLMLAFGSVIVPTVARARERRGLFSAKRLFTASLFAGLIALTLIFLVPMIWPAAVLKVFYPANAQNYLPHTRVLQVLTVFTLLLFVKEMSGSFLNAIEQPKLSFATQLCYTLAMVLIGMPLTARYGLMGMAIGATIAAAMHVALNAWAIRSLEQKHGGISAPPAPPAPSPAAF
ncbi:MAG: polysaccharide biosynthesis C-terminal domain-containing protein [Anaerolineae bacterium]|nr:polysaccharide biosynthesis C-terminal domain-containing protein [Phycisphaerae bacterium]